MRVSARTRVDRRQADLSERVRRAGEQRHKRRAAEAGTQVAQQARGLLTRSSAPCRRRRHALVSGCASWRPSARARGCQGLRCHRRRSTGSAAFAREMRRGGANAAALCELRGTAHPREARCTPARRECSEALTRSGAPRPRGAGSAAFRELGSRRRAESRTKLAERALFRSGVRLTPPNKVVARARVVRGSSM